MNPLNSVANSPVNFNDLSTKHTQPYVRVKSYSLESYCLLPDGREAVCRVRDFSTGALRQALASKLIAVNFGKDAYLLELLKGRTEHV